MLEDCENGIGPVDHVKVVGWMPVEPLVTLKTRPEKNLIGILVCLKTGRSPLVTLAVNLGVPMAGKEGGKVLPLKKLSKAS